MALDDFAARRRNCAQVIACAVHLADVESAADALHSALRLHSVDECSASCTKLTGTAFVADPWSDNRVYLSAYRLIDGRGGDVAWRETTLTIEQAVSVAWLLCESLEGEVWSDEVNAAVDRVVVGGERAPLLAQAVAA